MMVPVAESSPPQKLSGSSSRRIGPDAAPETSVTASNASRAHSRTTLPARAEATHSASDP